MSTLPAAPTVAVRGEWTAEVPPELARIRVAVGARSADRATALRDLARRVEEVRATLGACGAGVESVAVSPLRVRPQFRDGRPRERVTGYVAGQHLTVVVVDPEVLGDLLVRLADRDMVELTGPEWALRPDSEVHRRARTEAVRDARRRAEEYAAAAGSRLTGLVEIADTGLSGGPVSVAPAAFLSGVRQEVVAVDVEPVPQTVHAAVEARFTLTQPDFG
jgi:uncharacterized protein YggE